MPEYFIWGPVSMSNAPWRGKTRLHAATPQVFYWAYISTVGVLMEIYYIRR